MKEEQIYYDEMGNYGWSTHKQYPVVERKNWKYIVVDGKQIGVSKLPIKPLIRNFDDVVVNYVCGGWHRTHPCPAIGYSVYRKVTGKKISLKDYYKQYTKILRKI
jgi:hypothetical protein